jgi:hypothetical protein
MTENTDNTAVDQILNAQVQNKLIFIYNQREFHFDLADYGLTLHSDQQEVLSSIAPAIREHEQLGVDVDRGGYSMISTENNLFLMPKPDQG